MFDITADEISRLNDSDLRELVGRLCEAELVSRGLSPAFVTWGGDQSAGDGGVDVRVQLPDGVLIDGFIPRASTGFQVKRQDMPRKAIEDEMRPDQRVRDVIRDLVGVSGSYVIASSQGSTADSALRKRCQAMRDAVHDVEHAGQLHTDFFDRTRLATWVRRHPGVLLWARARLGRPLAGWRPFGSWSTNREGVEAEYLLDNRLRVELHPRDAGVKSVSDAIDGLRDHLRQGGNVSRLVGLSGVGKTRFVQALFDDRIESRPLHSSLAVYSNLADSPHPSPTALAAELVAADVQAVLIVDNCPFELHRSLVNACTVPASKLSLLTIEYDVRDDQPEGTQVVRLDTSSSELIERLIGRRYPHISFVDAGSVARVSGGNARIAIALAETIERGQSIEGLPDDELFQRLFVQRHGQDNALFLAAQACSLVYSFSVDPTEGDQSELTRLSSLIGQPPAETYRHVSQMLRRDLVQQRSHWRAVLPHAIANYLAGRALQDIPYVTIEQHLLQNGSTRLARSFARRLSFLHNHDGATLIVRTWLSPAGRLGDVAALDELGQAMFESVAPVLPEAALECLERAGEPDSQATIAVWHKYQTLLRLIAYEADLFDRCANLLAKISIYATDEQIRRDALETLASLFSVQLSGTHATPEQRAAFIDLHLASAEPNARDLGFAALESMLRASPSMSIHRFDFGMRSRDFGYEPRTDAEVKHWFGLAIRLLDNLIFGNSDLVTRSRSLFAQNFRDLWALTGMHDELERIARNIAAEGFWAEGWAHYNETLHYERDESSPELAKRLADLGKV